VRKAASTLQPTSVELSTVYAYSAFNETPSSPFYYVTDREEVPSVLSKFTVGIITSKDVDFCLTQYILYTNTNQGKAIQFVRSEIV
jgi:hypothetical protein